MAHSAAGPLPPADFASRLLPTRLLTKGEPLVRIHRTDLSVIHFGRTGDNRFDDPARQYGVCYLARSLEAAFAETFLRHVGATLVSRQALAARSASIVVATDDLRVAMLHGPGLARMGATGAVTSGTYDVSQPWSSAIHDHPEQVDGIMYRSNHDNGEFCVALFDRCADRIAAQGSKALLDDQALLARLLDRYEMGLA